MVSIVPPPADSTRLGSKGSSADPSFSSSPVSRSSPIPRGRSLTRLRMSLLDLVHEHDLKPEQIERIDVGTNSYVPNALKHTEPVTALEGKFSLQFQMSVGVVDRKAGIPQFTDAKVNEAAVRELMGRVHVYVDPEIEALGYNEMRMKVDIKLKDGRTFSGGADKAKGHPKKPMTKDDMREKFMECALLVMPRDRAESVLDDLWAIRERRVAEIVPKLVGDAR